MSASVVRRAAGPQKRAPWLNLADAPVPVLQGGGARGRAVVVLEDSESQEGHGMAWGGRGEHAQ